MDTDRSMQPGALGRCTSSYNRCFENPISLNQHLRDGKVEAYCAKPVMRSEKLLIIGAHALGWHMMMALLMFVLGGGLSGGLRVVGAFSCPAGLCTVSCAALEKL